MNSESAQSNNKRPVDNEENTTSEKRLKLETQMKEGDITFQQVKYNNFYC